MIEMENITKSYELNGKAVPILKGISLYVGRGDFVSIMGPSGSGKSTLSAILGCLSTPSSGQYKINDQDVTHLPQNKLARLRNQSIGFIFQDFNLLPGISALDNVALPLVYGGYSTKERKERALACLTDVGLGHKAANHPSQLSGGQKQRVAIARALVNHPKFLFADEPTGALDRKTGHEILGIMQRLNMLGHTVIQVTHSPADANYSKRILHLVEGNIVRDQAVEKPTLGAQGSSDEALNERMLTKMWRVAQFAPTSNPSDLHSLELLLNRSENRDILLAAARAVVRWNPKDSEKIVRRLFTSEDWVVRAELIKYSNLRPQSVAIPYFIEALSDPNPWVRHSAIVELKDIEYENIPKVDHDKILGCLHDQDERVRATAVYIVGKWSHPETIKMLETALRDPDGRVRANAIDAVREKQLEFELKSSLQPMIDDRSNRTRANAGLALSKTNPEIAHTLSKNMLGAQDPLMRASGAWLVGMVPTEVGGALLIELLREEKEEIVVNRNKSNAHFLRRPPK